ncbi:MAG: hypothetical protein ACHWZW_16460 [Spirulina sp.]
MTDSLSMGATSAVLRQSICRLSPPGDVLVPTAEHPELVVALEQLVSIVMTLRSPTAGWPADVSLTPQVLAPYISEEVWNVLDRLLPDDSSLLADAVPGAGIIPIPSLIPRLLWMLASSGYEVMHLVEGGRASLRQREESGTVSVVRLAPVLTLTTDQQTYALDLVTQADPSPPLWLAPDTMLSLLDYDLDGAWMSVESFLLGVAELVAQTQPYLYEMLTAGKVVESLCPFQPWRTATLRLHFYMADMGVQGGSARLTTGSPSPPPMRSSSAAFTLDDFAQTLIDEPVPSRTGVLGAWLTFTDKAWVRRFLHGHAQRVVVQGLPKLLQEGKAVSEEERELACATLAYRATQGIDGPKALFKHTFVQAPVMVADLWPRFRWYLAQSSERVMQLMGGLPAQVLSPGRGWQQGILSLRPLMILGMGSKTWVIDLGSGHLLPAEPLTLPGDAVIETTQAGDWANHQTIGDLLNLVERDLRQNSSAMAELAHGLPIHLRGLEGEEDDRPAQLTLQWCFTWAYGG